MNGEHMVAGSEENKRQDFIVNSIQGWELTTTEFRAWNLVSGNLGSCVGVAEMGTGIWNRLETYQYEFVGITGCNNKSH